jgi:hypothetical protein
LTNKVYFFQLRENVFNFAQKELAPKAAEIDKANEFADLKVSISDHYY